jgi:predicted component of viral defense system (DUF524 family)
LAIELAATALGPLSERVGEDVLLIDFGNAVGILDIPGVGSVEVVSGKWSRADHDAMLHELSMVASALPFAAGAPTSFPYDRSVVGHPDLRYHAFVYLRHVLSAAAPHGDQLLPALRVILADPHRRVTRGTHHVSLESVRRVDPSGLVGVASGRHPLVNVEPHAWQTIPLARALGGYLPSHMAESFVALDADTPENRFVKAFCDLILGVIEGVRQDLRSTRIDVFRQRLLNDCLLMEGALRPIRSHRLWTEVGSMNRVPAESPVLQRRRGYREVLRHFARLRLASRVPLPADLMADLLEAKDIALLYELWCYFTIVRELEALRGRPRLASLVEADRFQVSVRWGLETLWPCGVRLFYNRTFGTDVTSSARSYSVSLRPDIALHVPSGPGAGWHLFDAKFRLDRLDEMMPLTQTDDVPGDVEERRGVFKRADLHKMHAYRDAIAGARSSWIVYPGSDFRFFSEGGLAVNTTEQNRESMSGVGAVPLVPNDKQTPRLRAVLAKLLSVDRAAA